MEKFKVEKGSKRDLIISPKEGAAKACLVWMHGLGDSAEGFLSFFFSSDSPLHPSVKVRLLTAPKAPVSINNGYVMNSWFDILPNKAAGESSSRADVETNAAAVMQEIEKEAALVGGLKNVYVGGFSQGCAMALYIGLTYGDKLGGIIGLSGFLFPFLQLPAAFSPVFLVHGSDDDMISLTKAQTSYQRDNFVKSSNVQFHRIEDMGHSVAPEVIAKLRSWANTHIKLE